MTGMNLHGSITDEDKTFVETWENVAEGTNYIIQENRRGDEVQVGITGSRTFRLTTFDRMLTEDKALEDVNNPFKNGSFRPVIVPQHISIETNPNAMSEEDIQRLFKASEIAWQEYMKVITAPATLKRMIELAEDADLNLKRFRQLEGMYERFTMVNKRLTSSKDPAIQAAIDQIPGGAPTVSGVGGSRTAMRKPSGA